MNARTLWRACWDWLREVSGDAAYETYLRRAGRTPLSREAFWLERLERRYARIERCC